MRITVLLISVDYQSEPLPFWQIFGNRETVRIRFYYRGEAHILGVEEILSREFSSLAKQQTRRENYMKKLLLIALVVTGLAFVPVQRSDAQVSVGIGGIGVGFSGGDYGYPGYAGYYPYRYYRPYYYSQPYPYSYYTGSYYTGPSYYWYNGHRVYRHHRHHNYRYRY